MSHNPLAEDNNQNRDPSLKRMDSDSMSSVNRDEMQERRPSVLNIVSSFIGLIILIQFIILSVLVSVRLGNVDYSYATNFGNNWGGGPLTNMDIETAGNCPVGSTYALQNVKFPGFKAGCFCPPDKYYEGECTDSQLSQKCKYFPESAPKSVMNWGGTPCVKREKDTYFALNKTDSTAEDTNCPKDFKQCGILDTLNSQLCVADEEDCPVNYIEITNGAPGAAGFPVKTVDMGKGKKLTYSNHNLKGKIVNQFIVLDHQPCADSAENRIQLTPNDYECKNQVAGKVTDDSWEKLDEMDLQQFVEDNALTNQMEQYPFYEHIKSRPLNLYYRNYIGLNDTCRNLSLTLANSDEIPQQFTNLQEYVKTSNIDFISPASIAIYAIILIGLIIKIVITFTHGSSAHRLYINTIGAFSCLLLLIVALVSTISISNARNQYLWFNNYSDCSDPLNQALLGKLDANLQSAYTIGVIFTLLDLILFFLMIIEYLLKHCGDEMPLYEEEEDSTDGDDEKKEEVKDADDETAKLKKEDDKKIHEDEHNLSKASINEPEEIVETKKNK